jgi:hypothetical protein
MTPFESEEYTLVPYMEEEKPLITEGVKEARERIRMEKLLLRTEGMD